MAAATTMPISAPPPLSGVLAAEANLQPLELQDLADRVGDLTQLATQAGAELTFRLRIEVGSVGAVPPDVLARLNSVLEEIKAGLKVR